MKYTKTYKQVLNWRNNKLKESLRFNILRLLSYRAKPKKDFKGIQFVYFHYIYDDEIENAKKIIKWINANYKVISYSEAVKRLRENNIDNYYLCFSSDDGLKSNLVAAKIFNEYNISCCFFINPATIENRDVQFHNMVCTERLGVPLTEIMSWEDVKSLVTQGHEIGNHSFDHKVQAELSKEEFLEDLQKSTVALTDKVGEIKHYAYPRGLFKYFKKDYLDLIYSKGYLSCATAVRGCHITQKNKEELNQNLSIRRDVVVFNEPLSFIKYFLAKSQKKAKPENSFWAP